MAFGSSRFAAAKFADSEREGTPVVTVPGFSAGATAPSGSSAGAATATASSSGDTVVTASSSGSTRTG